MTITWHKEASSLLKCPVCGDADSKAFVLSIKNPLPYSEELDLYACQECQTRFFHPFELPGYEDDFGYKHYSNYYVELGAGIDFMIRPLVALANNNIKTFLDIGCGYGFTLDFAEKVMNWKAIGVEPSRYGSEGAELLNVEIYPEYLQKVVELEGKRFDLIYSTEVIEHVEEPAQFLGLMRRYLSPGGILALTTPNADYIGPKAESVTLAGVLSPGFHVMLFSPQSLKSLLEQQGFKHIEVCVLNHRLLAFASDYPFALQLDDRIMRDYYIRYLTLRLNEQNGTTILQNGIAYRLLKEYVNLGNYIDAKSILAQLNRLIETHYQFSLNNPEQAYNQIANNKSFESFIDVIPYNLSGILYYQGILQKNADNDLPASLQSFHWGYKIARVFLSIASAYFGEAADLLWRYRLEEASSRLSMGQVEASLTILNEIMNSAHNLKEIPLQDEILARVIRERFIILINNNLYERALAILPQLLEELNLKELLYSSDPGVLLDTILFSPNHVLAASTFDAQDVRFLYAWGMLALNYKANYRESAKLFKMCTLLAERLSQLNPDKYKLDDLYWNAYYHEALSYWYIGNPEQAEMLFLTMIQTLLPKSKKVFSLHPLFPFYQDILHRKTSLPAISPDFVKTLTTLLPEPNFDNNTPPNLFVRVKTYLTTLWPFA